MTYVTRGFAHYAVPEALKDSILDLQAEGLSSGEVARRLGIESYQARSVAKRAGSPFGGLQAYKRAKFAPPASVELLAALANTPPGYCMYIEGALHDPAARPCGEPCCTVTVNGRERQSSWCADHHLIVYPIVAIDATRKISKMAGIKNLARSHTGGVGGWRRV